MDSLKIIQPKIRIESPIGAIEADTGNPYLDGFMIISVLMIFYIGKRLVDKFAR